MFGQREARHLGPPAGKIDYMQNMGQQAADRLRECGVAFAAGLTDGEFDRVQDHFGFTFCPEHRAFLAHVLPIGERWVDWRAGDHDALAARLAWPTDGVVYDVLNNNFWPASWGQRPTEDVTAEAVARAEMAKLPKLIPIYSHRYLPAAPTPPGSPVFSCYQTDVVYYGDNVLDYIAHEFHSPPRHQTPDSRPHIPFWSDLAQWATSTDL